MFKLVVLSMLNSTRITIYSIMMVIRAKHDDPRNRIRICRFRKFHRWSVYIGRYCTCRQHLRLRVCQYVNPATVNTYTKFPSTPRTCPAGHRKSFSTENPTGALLASATIFSNISLTLFLSFSPRMLHFVAWPKLGTKL